MTRAESIAQEIVSRMTSWPMATVKPANVRRDPSSATDRARLPALIIETGSEDAPNTELLSIAYRSLQIMLTAIAVGDDAHLLADAAIQEAHDRLVEDTTLDGLCIDIAEGDTQRQRDALDTTVMAITKAYRITYRTDALSLI